MFPDSLIAQSYFQSETKVKHNLQFGIALCKKKLIYNVKNCPFTFKFDETTTGQFNKQYDGHKGKMKLSILHLGMGSPNMNKCFKEMFFSDLEGELDKSFLKLGTCSLHPVHSAFRKGAKMLSFHLKLLFPVVCC